MEAGWGKAVTWTPDRIVAKHGQAEGLVKSQCWGNLLMGHWYFSEASSVS
jgi:hypothetical protein